MATKIIVKNVTEPTEHEDTGRHWFQLEVAARRGLSKITAVRNFWLENRVGIDREDAVAAMEAGTDVGAGEDGVQLHIVDIEPRPVIIDGEQQVDKNGNAVFQRTANLIVLPGETIRGALDATFKGARLRGDVAMTDVADESDADLPDDALEGAAVGGEAVTA